MIGARLDARIAALADAAAPAARERGVADAAADFDAGLRAELARAEPGVEPRSWARADAARAAQRHDADSARAAQRDLEARRAQRAELGERLDARRERLDAARERDTAQIGTRTAADARGNRAPTDRTQDAHAPRDAGDPPEPATARTRTQARDAASSTRRQSGDAREAAPASHEPRSAEAPQAPPADARAAGERALPGDAAPAASDALPMQLLALLSSLAPPASAADAGTAGPLPGTAATAAGAASAVAMPAPPALPPAAPAPGVPPAGALPSPAVPHAADADAALAALPPVAADAGSAPRAAGDTGTGIESLLRETPAAFALPAPAGVAARAIAVPQLAPVALPADPQAGFDDGFGSRIVWMAEQRLGHADIRVTPEHLGTIEVRLQLDGAKVSAEFYSAQPEVRQALESGIGRLRDLLGQHGLQLAHADVGQQRSGRGGEPNGAGSAPVPADAESPAAPAVIRSRRLLDEIA